MARNRTRFVRGGRQVRETSWQQIATVETSLTGAPSVVLSHSASAALLALRPFTIVRVRGVLQCQSDQVIASESYGVGIGMAVVSDQAVAIGVTAVPTPVTDRGSDLWLLYESLFARFNFADGTGLIDPMGRFIQFDSKAMRKVEEGQDVIITQENELNGCLTVVAGRMLVKLH